ncbi:unnamed protein product [Chrysoparadoxa australica]
MYCGDEIAAIVGDVGSHTAKFGYAGEDQPKHVYSSVVGEPGEQDAAPSKQKEACTEERWGSPSFGSLIPHSWCTSRRLVGDLKIGQPRGNTELRSPLKDGVVEDWDQLESLWDHAFQNCLGADPSERPVLCAQASWSCEKQQERLMELMFETFNVPAMYVAKSGMLSAFAAGRTTALVCECGHGSLSVVPVVEGYVMGKALQRGVRGGAWLTQQVAHHVTTKGVQLQPRYAAGRAYDVGKLPANLHESFADFHRTEIARDLKETCLAVPLKQGDNVCGEVAEAIGGSCYELPDGTKIQLTPELCGIGGAVFAPSESCGQSAPVAGQGSSNNGGLVDKAFGELVHSALAQSDGDSRKELASNLVLTGGGSLLRGMPERLTQDAARDLPTSVKLRVLAGGCIERKFGVWIGGSILSSLGTFQQLWLSKAEYGEYRPKPSAVA